MYKPSSVHCGLKQLSCACIYINSNWILCKRDNNLLMFVLLQIHDLLWGPSLMQGVVRLAQKRE